MDELTPVGIWIADTLADLVTAYRGMAPPDAPNPHVEYHTLANTDSYYVGRARALTEQVWQIVAVMEEGYGATQTEMSTLAAEIDSRIGGGRVMLPGGVEILSRRREGQYSDIWERDGRTLLVLGGVYKLLVT